MKMKFGLILGTLISTTLLAQEVTNAPPPPMEMTPPPATTVMEPPAAAPATNAPAAKPAKKKSTKKSAKKSAPKKSPAAAAELKTTPLVAGPAVVTAHHVNVRTRAGLSGEVIGHLTNGEPVTVIEEIKLKHSGAEEPSAWAKINLPGSAKAWVKSSYLDANKTVTANKLNIRGGPGENYGVLGRLQKGDSVTEVESKGDWTQITPPANAYAFVAAQYLSQEASAIAAANQTTTPTVTTTTEATNVPPVTPTTVPETPTVAQTTTEAPMTNTMTSAEIISNELAAASSTQTNLTETNTTTTTTVEAPPEPRIVEREGIVRGNTSIQSPTKFELISPDDHKLINYLYTTSTNLDLSRYKGLHIIVTGEEGMDERWKYTPVITIQKIQVLE